MKPKQRKKILAMPVILTDHARSRLRERFGITDPGRMTERVRSEIHAGVRSGRVINNRAIPDSYFVTQASMRPVFKIKDGQVVVITVHVPACSHKRWIGFAHTQKKECTDADR